MYYKTQQNKELEERRRLREDIGQLLWEKEIVDKVDSRDCKAVSYLVCGMAIREGIRPEEDNGLLYERLCKIPDSAVCESFGQMRSRLENCRENAYTSQAVVLCKHAQMVDRFLKKQVPVIENLLGERQVYCSCGTRTSFVFSGEYFNRDFGMIYFCPKCRRYAGVHRYTNIPLTEPVDRRMHQLRRDTHRHLLRLQQARGWTKRDTYDWLADRLQLKEREMYVSSFDEDICRKVLALVGAELRR